MTGFSTKFNRPQFTPNSGTGNQTRKGFDRPITVTGYDLTKQQILGEHKGIKYAFSVKPDVMARIEESIRKNAHKNTNTTPAPYMGHLIDERMKKAIPVGSKAVVSNSEVVESKNASGVKVAVIDRVKRIDVKKSKLLEDRIITATAKIVKGQLMVSHFQVRDNNGIDINDLDGLEKLAKRLDVSSQSYGTKIDEAKVVKPGTGVRFITAYPSEDFDEYTQTHVHYVIHKTELYDYVAGEQDESGNTNKDSAHLLTGEEMMTIREQYIEFVENDPELQAFRAQVKARDPNLDLVIEACAYDVYPASSNSNNMISVGTMGTPEYAELNKHLSKKPLYQMTHGKSYFDLGQTGFMTGGDIAIKTCLEVTANKAVDDGNGNWVTLDNNWAKQLFVNGTRGDALSMIRTSTGAKMKAHERLAVVRDNVPATAAVASADQSQPNHQQQAPVSRPQAPASRTPVQAPAPVQAEEEEIFFDIFNEKSVENEAPAPAPARAPIRFARKTSTES